MSSSSHGRGLSSHDFDFSSHNLNLFPHNYDFYLIILLPSIVCITLFFFTVQKQTSLTLCTATAQPHWLWNTVLTHLVSVSHRQTTPTIVLESHKSKRVVEVWKSVPLAHVDVVFVHKQANVGKERLPEALILRVLHRLSTRLRTWDRIWNGFIENVIFIMFIRLKTPVWWGQNKVFWMKCKEVKVMCESTKAKGKQT